MEFGKHLAGVALFFFIFSSTVIITRYLTSPIDAVPPIKINVTQPAVIGDASPVKYRVRMVSLDFISGKSYVTLLLKREDWQSMPEKIRVRALFFAPGRDSSPSWSTLGEIRRPFSHGDRVEITAKADCDWCKDSRIPKAGYFAQVHVSTDGEESQLAAEPVVSPIPVVIQSERNANPLATR